VDLGHDFYPSWNLSSREVNQTFSSPMPRRKTSTSGRVAGLIARPTGPLDEDMRTALQERENLITTKATAALDEAIEHGASWVAKLSTPGPSPRERQKWRELAVSVALYRHRYDIHEPAPLGTQDTVTSPQQEAERRIALAALRQARAAQDQPEASASHRIRRQRDQRRSL
ncbi:hypothetical protein ACH0B7_14935, partial [Brevibacterium luteolum]|nr:hypothetical protein [Brevibacterium luteolum]